MARAKIDKHVLDELKSLSSPPENVKETLSVAVAVVNKEKPPKEWKDVQKALSNSGFVKAIQAHDDTVAKEAAPALKKYAAKHKLEDIKSKVRLRRERAAPLETRRRVRSRHRALIPKNRLRRSSPRGCSSLPAPGLRDRRRYVCLPVPRPPSRSP